MNTVYGSFLHLANNNNGLFVSDKQAEFLTKYANGRDGCVGHLQANKSPVFVELDDLGIVKMYYHSSTKKGSLNTTIFERKVAGMLNDVQIKEIKILEKRLKKFEKKLSEYVSEGRVSGCTYDMTVEAICGIKKAIEAIKN